jgi:2-methylcitrate synthase
MRLFEVAERIESVMHDAKRMFPNLDWYSRLPIIRWAFPSIVYAACL